MKILTTLNTYPHATALVENHFTKKGLQECIISPLFRVHFLISSIQNEAQQLIVKFKVTEGKDILSPDWPI